MPAHDELTASEAHGTGPATLGAVTYATTARDTADALLFQFIPKRVLSAAQVAGLRALAAAAGARGA